MTSILKNYYNESKELINKLEVNSKFNKVFNELYITNKLLKYTFLKFYYLNKNALVVELIDYEHRAEVDEDGNEINAIEKSVVINIK